MNYLLSDKNTLIWLVFTIYAVSTLFILPDVVNWKTSTISEDVDNNALQLASRLILRIALILPMLSMIKSNI